LGGLPKTYSTCSDRIRNNVAINSPGAVPRAQPFATHQLAGIFLSIVMRLDLIDR